LKFGFFDATSFERVIVATDQNVVAALSVKDGQILWRQILEIHARGDIKLLHVHTDPKTAMSLAQKQLGVITVSGFNPALVRGWSADNGILEWEWSLIPNAPDRAEESFWFYHNQNLIHIIPFWESHLEVSEYNANTGTPARSTSSKITAPWIRQKNCVLAAPYFACALKNQLLAINLVSKDSQIVTKVFEEDIAGFKLEAVLVSLQ
jgi:ER membrane protein complex subunit 1